MTQLFNVNVGTHTISTKTGLPVYVSVGTPLAVEGTPHVRVGHGTIVPAAGWHAERRDALTEAATTVEQYARALLLQADKLRQGVTDG